MKIRGFVILACLVAAAIVATCKVSSAQTVPGPRLSVAWTPSVSPTCEGGSGDPWAFTYGLCYLPAGINLGSPYILNVRVTFTGATTVQVLVPRGQVVLETTAARCGGQAPCYRISDLPAPAGAFNVTMAYVDAEGRAGAPSTAFPFSGAPPVPATLANPRIP